MINGVEQKKKTQTCIQFFLTFPLVFDLDVLDFFFQHFFKLNHIDYSLFL